MFCQNCGAPISDNSAFCAECGARQPVSDISNETNVSVSVLPPVPSLPQESLPGESASSSMHKSQPVVSPTAEPARRGTSCLPLIIGIIAGGALLLFAVVQYSDSFKTLLKPDQGMPQDFDVEPSTVVMTEPVKPATDAPAKPELPPESVYVPEAEENKDSEGNMDFEEIHLYDLQDYETFEPATLADFNWVTYDIAHGILPTGMDRLESFEEIEGGWKLYIIDEPNGENSTTMERLCRCTFAENEQGRSMCITWDYVHNNTTDKGFEDHSPDSSYYGSWENGMFDGLGAGGVKITDFWNANGHEYAVGRMSWPDGIHAFMFLTRP
ncbi:MAG: zinc ribbon domain-containing protein [Lachnospiraceae bacterium]|nr:zinc ribbon domain-containing protein [Lachnospiraceae bacterium]